VYGKEEEKNLKDFRKKEFRNFEKFFFLFRNLKRGQED